MPACAAYDGILPSSVRKCKKYGIVNGMRIEQNAACECMQDSSGSSDSIFKKGNTKMKKQILTVLVIASAVTLAGCSSSKKETEAPAPETQAQAVQSEAAVAETQAQAAETEAAVVATEAEAAVAAVETEAKAVVAAAETEAETAVAAVETEAEAAVAAVETEAETVGAETEEELYIDALGDETEYDYWETESEYDYFFDETETEAEIIPRPEFNASDYLTLEDDEYMHMTVQTTPAIQVTEEEIDSEIANNFSYLEDYDELIIKKTEGTVQNGDTVNIDYTGKKDGEAFDGGTAEDQELVIGSGSFIPGFEEGLIGKEIGSTVDLNLTFPEDYGVEELNGADVVFTVTINYVSEMPEMTDEIAEKMSDGEYKTLEEYRESIRAEIQEGYDEDHDNQVTSLVMQKLTELYPVEEYPQANVDYSVDMILSQYITPYASMYGMSTEDFVSAAYGMSYDEFMEAQLIPAGQQMVAQEIVLGAIAEKEGITMTEEELQERLQGYADQFGVTVDDVTQGQDMGYIRVNELNQKVMDWLREKTTVVEISETEAETEADVFAAGTEAETDAAPLDAAQTESEE